MNELDKKCKVCDKKLWRYYNEYSCGGDNRDHFYAERYEDDKLRICKCRIEKLCVRFYYDKNITEVYLLGNYSESAILNSILNLDFSNLNKVKQKLKLILLFS